MSHKAPPKPPIPAAAAPLKPGPSMDWARDVGPLRVLLEDPSISEIMVNGPDRIFVERNGLIQQQNMRFESKEILLRIANALAINCAKELNIRNPFVDARLPDGSRINIAIPPIALESPLITIRKFSAQRLMPSKMMEIGAFDKKILFFLSECVKARRNIIISGGTGSGKTTMLNLLSSFIPSTERVVTIEDTPELQLPVANVARLVSKAPMGSDEGIDIADLLVNALRMRPDRIVVGECRGPEAWDMLQAMNTGHEGSLTTLHANSSFDALRRLESMIMRTGIDAPVNVIKEDIGETVHVVVQVARFGDGKRRVTEIREINGFKDGVYMTRKIFHYNPDIDRFLSTGQVPQFVEESARASEVMPAEFFDPENTKVNLRKAG